MIAPAGEPNSCRIDAATAWSSLPAALLLLTTRRRSSTRRAGAAEQALDLFEQPRQLDRLGVVIIATGGHRLVAIAGHRMCGQADDRDPARRRIARQPPRRLPA